MPFPTTTLKAAARAPNPPKILHNAALKTTPAAGGAATSRRQTTKDTKPQSASFLRYIFQPTPSFPNCCTHETTAYYLAFPSHPNHIRTSRRAHAFDPTKLHWSVTAHTDVSKKRTVRSWAKRRVVEAVREELRKRGFGPDGSVIGQGDDGVGTGGSLDRERPGRGLSGALRIYMALDDRKKVLTATGEEVRETVGVILSNVIRRQAWRGGSRPGERARQEWRGWQRRPPRRK